MSRWTHVVGCIQCSWDYEKAEKCLGRPVLWDDHNKLGLKWDTPEYEDYFENVWKKAFEDNKKGEGIPMGSEGSLDWYFVQTKDEHVLGEGSLIAIQGDLRDYGWEDEVEYIIKWFKRAAFQSRFATLTINDEWSDNFITITITFGIVNVYKSPKDKGERYENN